MENILIVLIISTISCIVTIVIKQIATKKNILDTPNERSSHVIPTPRGGGLAIVIGWFLGLFYFYFLGKLDKFLFLALISGIIIVIIGILDDIYNIKPIIRIIGQSVSVILALFFLGGLKSFDIGIYKLEIYWLITPLAFIGMIWLINLYNFLDGIDGYASMQAIFLSFSFFYFTSGNYYLVLAAATLGFLIWNWQPAKIFMGDVGSTLLGFNFGVFAIYEQNENSIPIIVFLILTSLFWFDASLTLIRRFRNNEKLTEAHKRHAYQRIVQYGFSHKKTVIFAFSINLILFSLAYIALRFKELMIFSFFLCRIFLFFIIKLIDKRKPF